MTVDDTVQLILHASTNGANSFNQFPTGVRGLDEVLAAGFLNTAST